MNITALWICKAKAVYSYRVAGLYICEFKRSRTEKTYTIFLGGVGLSSPEKLATAHDPDIAAGQCQQPSPVERGTPLLCWLWRP